MATLLVATGMVYLFEQGGVKIWHGIQVFMVCGYEVEGNWFAIAVRMTADWTNSGIEVKIIKGAHLTCTRVKKGMFSSVIDNQSSSLVVGDLNVCV